MPPKKTTPNPAPKTNNNGLAAVAYLLFFVPLLTDAKNDAFVKFHVKQGVVLFIAWIGVGIFSMVPIIGWFLSPFLFLGLMVLMLIGILNALGGKMTELPLIGQYAQNFTI